ncbi:MAG: hypothetical protein RLZZ398_306 [Verrucomicrobiota bacterium]|jgi:hypothetical protein
MKIILSALVILALPLRAEESLNEGLFVPDRNVAQNVEVTGGEIVHRQKAKRLKPTRITFRPDTEDKEKFWLEMDLPVLADPGDFYVFLIGDHTSFSGFVVRGGDQHGCKWALGLRDREQGRELLRKIGEVYDLPKTNIEDKTKGEQ